MAAASGGVLVEGITALRHEHAAIEDEERVLDKARALWVLWRARGGLEAHASFSLTCPGMSPRRGGRSGRKAPGAGRGGVAGGGAGSLCALSEAGGGGALAEAPRLVRGAKATCLDSPAWFGCSIQARLWGSRGCGCEGARQRRVVHPELDAGTAAVPWPRPSPSQPTRGAASADQLTAREAVLP